QLRYSTPASSTAPHLTHPLTPLTPPSTPFPYTTLFRSHNVVQVSYNNGGYGHSNLLVGSDYKEVPGAAPVRASTSFWMRVGSSLDRKSTRLNSSHGSISYAVFCLKKKKRTTIVQERPT